MVTENEVSEPEVSEQDTNTERTEFTRAHWVISVCSAAALAGMVAVVVFARADTRDKGGRGGKTSAMGPSDVFGSPRAALERARNSACGTADPQMPAQLEFELDAPELDFGTLKQGVKATLELTFVNAGTGPLCVYDVKTGCGCLKVRLKDAPESKRFEPGASGRLTLSVDTTGRHGVIKKHVTMLTNDPKNPAKRFPVKMDVSGGLIVEPHLLDFGHVARGLPMTRDVLLRSRLDGPAWKVTGVTGTRRPKGGAVIPYTYKVEIVKDPRFHKVRISVTHPGSDQIAMSSDSVLIETTHPERKEVQVPSRINVVPRIMCRSRVISLGYVRSGAARPPTRARIQAGATHVQFKITGVEVQPPDGESPTAAGPGFTATHGTDARGAWVDVKYDGKNRQPGLLQAVLVVSLDDPGQPELRVPVRATVRAPRKP